jgi:hypothetical protein
MSVHDVMSEGFRNASSRHLSLLFITNTNLKLSTNLIKSLLYLVIHKHHNVGVPSCNLPSSLTVHWRAKQLNILILGQQLMACARLWYLKMLKYVVTPTPKKTVYTTNILIRTPFRKIHWKYILRKTDSIFTKSYRNWGKY